MADIYEIITERIVALLETGTAPWRKPWRGGRAGMPGNLHSKKHYRGINPFLLTAAGRGSRWWLTYNQAKAKGGQVRKGEKGTPVVFWKRLEVNAVGEDGAVTKRGVPLLRFYTVFNLDQIDDITDPDVAEAAPAVQFEPVEAAERIVSGYKGGPVVRYGGGRACYRTGADEISMPARADFDSAPGFYSTLFHEMGHSTGHDKRLGRKGITEANGYGSSRYSQEELVAEMTAAFLLGDCNLEAGEIENNAAYIQGWLAALKNDKKLVVMAAAQAQKASDYILGIDPAAISAQSEE